MVIKFPVLDAHDELLRIGKTVLTQSDEESIRALKDDGQIDRQYKILTHHLLNTEETPNPRKRNIDKADVTTQKKMSKTNVVVNRDDDDGSDAEEERDKGGKDSSREDDREVEPRKNVDRTFLPRGAMKQEPDMSNEKCTYSDSDVEILDEAACVLRGNSNPFVSTKTYIECIGNGTQDIGESSDEFRKAVVNALKEPFDAEEYKRHQEAIKIGKYFDFHPDLRGKLKRYRYNRRKRLSILRGFFYWVQNLTQEGAFKPWNDRACLAMEPPEDARKV